MAGNTNDFGTLLAAGMLGLGGGLSAASATRDENERRREGFRAQLRAAFEAAGAGLVAATLGRGEGNAPFWDVTLQVPTGELSSARVPLSTATEPYSGEALQTVIATITSTLLSGHG